MEAVDRRLANVGQVIIEASIPLLGASASAHLLHNMIILHAQEIEKG